MTTRFAFLDGRMVDADSPAALFERLRQQEQVPPATLGRYLDLLQSRASLGFGIRVDVGERTEDIDARCRKALVSLVNHGWLRRLPHERGFRMAVAVR